MARQDLVTELFYSGAWNPAPAYERDPVSITRGRGDEAGEAPPSALTGTLDDRTGDYNPRNAMSPLYGLIGRNTPIRSGLTLVTETFGGTSSSGWTPADTGQAWTGVGAGAADFTESGGIGRHLQPVINIVRISVLPENRRDVEQVATAAVPAVATGASAVAAHIARYQDSSNYYWMRMEFDTGGALTAKISKVVGGVFTDLATLSSIPGYTYTAGQGWNFRSSVNGRRLSIRIWQAGTTEPSDWTLSVVDNSITAAGRYGLASWVVAGNTNTTEVRFDNYQAVDRRIVAEVAAWKPDRTLDFTIGGQGDAWTAIEGAGILRRLSQGNDPLGSPLRRRILDLNPTAYWPLEDGDGSLSAQSAVDGVDPMQPYGYSRFQVPGSGGDPQPAAGLPNFGTGTGIPGSAPVPDFTQGGVLVGHPPVPTSGTQSWRVAFVAVFPRDKQANATTFIGWSVNAGTYTDWLIQAESTGLFVTAEDPATLTAGYGTSTATINLFDGLPHFIEVNAQTVAGALDARIYIDGWEYGTVHTINAPNLNYPPGWVRSITPNVKEWNASSTNISGMPQIGHIAVWQPSASVSGHVEAMGGYLGETAGARFLRLCSEEDVPASLIGAAADTRPMGVQRTGVDLAEHLGEIERTDGGLVYEPRDGLGLVLRTVATLYNQTAALTLDWAAKQVAPPFRPVVDDLGTRNDVTARSTTTDATVRAVLDVGPMSTQPPPAGVGRAGGQLDVNPADTIGLADLAWWGLHKGTVDEMRVASVTVDLTAVPAALVAAAAAVDTGDRIFITGLPVDMGSNQVSLLAFGSTEVIGSHTRTITFNCVPGSVYDVAAADGMPRVAADGSTLAAGISAADTVIAMSHTTANGSWTSDPTDFPLDVRVGGERVRADAPGNVMNPNPWFVSNVSSWSGSGCSIAWTATGRTGTTWGAALVTPDGVSATGNMISDPVVVAELTAYRFMLWAQATTASVEVSIAADWQTAGGTPISSSFGSVVTLTPGVWTPLSVTFTSPATTGRVLMRNRFQGTPPSSSTWKISGFTLATEATTTGVGAFQRLTSAPGGRGVNGVNRAWSTGTAVDVWTPAVVPL